MIKNPRRYSALDQFCFGIDQAVRAVSGKSFASERAYPAKNESESELTREQQQRAASLMRINHAGEVCAQALYHAQGWISRNPQIQKSMQHAALEEGDHLAWCSQRITELGGHTSYLNPLWYIGSFALGTTAGLMGDRWSLGFLAETETQVVAHLEKQLTLLPMQDQKSYKILHQMQIDESQHRDQAIQTGAAVLPGFIKKIMSLVSRIMVKTSYWV